MMLHPTVYASARETSIPLTSVNFCSSTALVSKMLPCITCKFDYKTLEELRGHLMTHTKKELIWRITNQMTNYHTFFSQSETIADPSLSNVDRVTREDANGRMDGKRRSLRIKALDISINTRNTGTNTDEIYSFLQYKYIYLCHFCNLESETKEKLSEHLQIHLEEQILRDVLSLEQDFFVRKNGRDLLFKFFSGGYHYGRNHAGQAHQAVSFYSMFLQNEVEQDEETYGYHCTVCGQTCKAPVICNNCDESAVSNNYK